MDKDKEKPEPEATDQKPVDAPATEPTTEEKPAPEPAKTDEKPAPTPEKTEPEATQEPDYKALYEAAKAKVDEFETAKTEADAKAAREADAQKVTDAITPKVEDKTLRAYDAKAVAALVNRDALKVLADGTVKGIDEEIARIQKDFPGMFRPLGKVDGSAQDAPDTTTPSNPVSLMSAAYAENAANRR